MKDSSNTRTAALAFGASAGHWILCSLVVGGEAWDGGIYFATLPLLAITCALLGASVPRTPWRFGWLASGGQVLGLLVSTGGAGSMLPVGLFLLAVLGAALSLCGWIGARLGARRVAT